ncbi:MAG TPA: hypothetical protein DCX46_08430 [Bacteroidetes bacterium]|nr:hypothetical protein [Bacteroidota bacterium]
MASPQLYMAELDLPVPFTQEFISLIPAQRLAIGKLMTAGAVLSISVAADRSKAWTIISAKSEEQAREIISKFPISNMIRYTLRPLFVHETVDMGLPKMSMN